MKLRKVILWILVVLLAGVAVFSAIEGTKAYSVTLSHIDETAAQKLSVTFDISEQGTLYPGTNMCKTFYVKNDGNFDSWIWLKFGVSDAWAPYITVTCPELGWRLLPTVEHRDGFQIYTVLCDGAVAPESAINGSLVIQLSPDIEYMQGCCYYVQAGEKIKFADSTVVETNVEVFAVQRTGGAESIDDVYISHAKRPDLS